MHLLHKIFLFILFSILASTPGLAFSKNVNGHVIFQLGGFHASQGKSQHIGINGLIGNDYNVTQRHDMSALFGLGYYLDGSQKKSTDLSYGIDAFLLYKTQVKGDITQENLFTNLNYQYDVIYTPIYAAFKTAFHNASNKYALTMDFGLGPDIINTKNYTEHSLDGGVTIPDNAFSEKTKVDLSAMAGIGIKINHALGRRPVECGYRFFYLGQGELKKNSDQILSNLKVGKAYAHGFLCAVSF